MAGGTVQSFTGYSATGSTVAGLTAKADAARRLMRILADQVVQDLTVDVASAPVRRLAVRPPGATLRYRARVAGWYVLHVSVTRPGAGPYRLVLSKLH